MKNFREYEAPVNLLRAEPRAAGTYGASKVICDGVSCFEQTVVIESWLIQRRIRNVLTFFISTLSDYISLQVKKIQRKGSRLIDTIDGSTRMSKKLKNMKVGWIMIRMQRIE